MDYKELKEEQPKPTHNCVTYAEIISTVTMTAMMCGTLLLTTQMWVSERRAEMVFLRGSTP